METNTQYDLIKKQITEFINSTQETIGNFCNNLHVFYMVSDAVDVICSCKGKIITTGMGKAGYAAEKAASSFSSLGMAACYLHPAQASHGDSGIIQNGDVMLALSNSGKTREVIETIQLARNLGIDKVISITSHEASPVRDLSDVIISMGPIQEAGHLALAPTTSIIMMLIVSDMIATISAQRRGLTIQEFGLRHHGGYLGQKCRGEEK
jgi:arabinose-5-phosphate isomerase